MSLAYSTDHTVPAFPLGQPLDGRPRYSMTASMARIYRWIVMHRPHTGMFQVHFRDVAADTGIGLYAIHSAVQGLVERGWLYVAPNAGHTKYGLVAPVKMFRERSHE